METVDHRRIRFRIPINGIIYHYFIINAYTYKQESEEQTRC
jgi:hypothetical protein